MVIPTEKPEPELTSKDINTVLCICIKLLGGVSVPQAMLEAAPKDLKLKAAYDEVNKVWCFSVPVKRKRGIIKPKRKLIVPGRN